MDTLRVYFEGARVLCAGEGSGRRRILRRDQARSWMLGRADDEAEAELGAPVAVWATGATTASVAFGGRRIGITTLGPPPDRIRERTPGGRSPRRAAVDDPSHAARHRAGRLRRLRVRRRVRRVPSGLLVPRRIVGRRDGVAFRTDIEGGSADAVPLRLPPSHPRRPVSRPMAYEDAVAEAVAPHPGRRAREGGARPRPRARGGRRLRRRGGAPRPRDRLPRRLDLRGRRLLRREPRDAGARTRQPRHRAGARRHGAARRTTPAADAAARDDLLASPKNRFEHRFAVRQPAAHARRRGHRARRLRPPVRARAAERVAPRDGRRRPGSATAAPALDLVAALHPTAAVAGAPAARPPSRDPASWNRSTGAATRARSAGSARRGDGEWAIGLRSAEVEAPTQGPRICRRGHRRRIRGEERARRDGLEVLARARGARAATAQRGRGTSSRLGPGGGAVSAFSRSPRVVTRS